MMNSAEIAIALRDQIEESQRHLNDFENTTQIVKEDGKSGQSMIEESNLGQRIHIDAFQDPRASVMMQNPRASIMMQKSIPVDLGLHFTSGMLGRGSIIQANVENLSKSLSLSSQNSENIGRVESQDQQESVIPEILGEGDSSRQSMEKLDDVKDDSVKGRIFSSMPWDLPDIARVKLLNSCAIPVLLWRPTGVV